MSRTSSIALVVAGLLVGGAAWAQEAPESSPRGADESLRIENGAFVIEGRIQKPEVVVVIRRETLDEGLDLDLERSFLREIVDATQEAPF